ncbi:hypothetical protein [Aquimarina hainanensis]
MLYTELKEKESEIKELTKLGVVSSKWLSYIQIYEDFHKNPEIKKIERYNELCTKYGFKDVSNIRKIIRKLKQYR